MGVGLAPVGVVATGTAATAAPPAPPPTVLGFAAWGLAPVGTFAFALPDPGSDAISLSANITEARDTLASTMSVVVDGVHFTANITEVPDAATSAIVEARDTATSTMGVRIGFTGSATEARDTSTASLSSENAPHLSANITEARDTSTSTMKTLVVLAMLATEMRDTGFGGIITPPIGVPGPGYSESPAVIKRRRGRITGRR